MNDNEITSKLELPPKTSHAMHIHQNHQYKTQVQTLKNTSFKGRTKNLFESDLAEPSLLRLITVLVLLILCLVLF